MSRRLLCIAFLARQPGLAVLRDVLHPDSTLLPRMVITHGRGPVSEGSRDRAELSEFRDVCRSAGVPLSVLDFPEARNPSTVLESIECDLIISLSWRARIPFDVINRSNLGGVNLHRGMLPKYAGGSPVRRALSDGEDYVTITAHELDEEIDKGPELATVRSKISSDEKALASIDLDAAAELVKSRITPLYAPLLRAAVASRLSSVC